MKNLVFFSFLFMAACNSSETKTGDSKQDSSLTKQPPVSNAECYVMANGKDSATLQLTLSGVSFSGRLIYNLFQKDKNEGEISGIVNDTLLLGNYTFMSEGMTSIREVVFKLKDGKLYEGFGEVIEKANGVSFTDITKLQYHPVPFIKVSCK